MMRRVAVATAIGLLLGGQAMAAEARLGAVSGSVMVNQGGRFVAATRGAVLQTGDRVMATNGSASLVYSDGCNVAVATRSMATVAAVSPCAGGSSLVKVDDDRGGAPGYGGGAGGGGGGGLALWGLFGIAAAAAVGAAVGEDEDPNTP
jgi:hypothetical protein